MAGAEVGCDLRAGLGGRGETACLVCYQHGGYLMWLSVGDNQLYLLHPELQRLGQ